MNIVGKSLNYRSNYIGGYTTNNIIRENKTGLNFYRAPSDSLTILDKDGNSQYTAIFNPFTNDFGYKKFTRESSVYDIIEPMFSDNNGAIISLISPELNDMCKNYNMLPDSITDALNEGNRVLLINSFKRK